MNEDKASKIIAILFPFAALFCIIGAILELQNIGCFAFPSFAFVALTILVICYIIGTTSFPEWNKKPKVKSR